MRSVLPVRNQSLVDGVVPKMVDGAGIDIYGQLNSNVWISKNVILELILKPRKPFYASRTQKPLQTPYAMEIVEVMITFNKWILIAIVKTLVCFNKISF